MRKCLLTILLTLVMCPSFLPAEETPTDILLELEHIEDGALKSVELNGKAIFEAAKHRRLTIFERHPHKTLKRVYLYGKMVYEQSWDRNGKPLGEPFIVLSRKEKIQQERKPGAPTGDYLPKGLTAASVRKRILSYEGVPYKSGGYDRNGFKTAGLIWHFFQSYSQQVPLLLKEQAEQGKFILKKDLAPGDVCVFSTNGDKRANILGLYAGNDEMLYMSYSKKKARLMKMNTPYWNKYYIGSRRYFGLELSGASAFQPTEISATVAVPRPRSTPRPTHIPLPTGKEYQQGIASFYGGGDGFDGSPTANGEVFDDSKFTAAHRTLPFNTKVKVVRTDTGQSVTVRINDRGPFIRGRIINLSFAAAKKIDMVSSGVKKVKLYIVK